MSPDWITAIAIIITVIIGLITLYLSVTKKIDSRANWEGSVDARLNNLEKFMLEVKHDVRKINDNLLKVFSLLGPDVKSSQSPIELTSLGKKISEKLNADHYASKLADMVRENVKGKDPYDIQEFSFEYVQNDSHYSDEERRKIRTVAYEKGVSEYKVREVIGLELRDKLLKSKNMDAPQAHCTFPPNAPSSM